MLSDKFKQAHSLRQIRKRQDQQHSKLPAQIKRTKHRSALRELLLYRFQLRRKREREIKMNEKNYVLASSSPRRIEMMRAHGLEPTIIPADIEENIPAIGGMNETVMFLALKKAKAVEALILSGDKIITPGSVIIAADTVVYKDRIMGKPSNFQDAYKMLTALRGTWHYVATGVALVCAGENNARVFTDVTKVYFKNYSDEDLLEYLKTDEAYDKAGGYAIQGYFSKYVEKIEGCYDTVVGFPWDRIQEEISKF